MPAAMTKQHAQVAWGSTSQKDVEVAAAISCQLAGPASGLMLLADHSACSMKPPSVKLGAAMDTGLWASIGMAPHCLVTFAAEQHMMTTNTSRNQTSSLPCSRTHAVAVCYVLQCCWELAVDSLHSHACTLPSPAAPAKGVHLGSMVLLHQPLP